MPPFEGEIADVRKKIAPSGEVADDASADARRHSRASAQTADAAANARSIRFFVAATRRSTCRIRS